MKNRLSYQDVSGRIDVCDPDLVRDEVRRLIVWAHPGTDLRVIDRAFTDFARLFRGTYPGYHACDTPYHDMQHSLDVTLAMARLVAGHDLTVGEEAHLGADRAVLGIVVALFHDIGYLRSRKDTRHQHGAEYTRWHVARSARFIEGWLSRQRWLSLASMGGKLVHFTGYEVALDCIRLRDPRDWRLGCMVGTADLIAQMSARTYLEKCRDHLFEEFALGGMTEHTTGDGAVRIRYASPEDLLRKTPAFYENEVRRRLDEDFDGVYRYAAACLGGRNLYMEELENNIAYLRFVLDQGDFGMLRRSPASC